MTTVLQNLTNVNVNLGQGIRDTNLSKDRHMYFKNTTHFKFKGYYPTYEKPQGECQIAFKRQREHTITLEHDQILSHFIEGNPTALTSETYGLFAESKVNLGEYKLTILQQDFRLTMEEAHELCDHIIHFALEYANQMRINNRIYGFGQFEKSKCFQSGYRLLKLDRRLWKDAIEFASEHSCEIGDSSWYMFENDPSLIKVLDMNDEKNRYDFVLYPEQVESTLGSFKYPDHEVWMVWQPIHQTENGIILEKNGNDKLSRKGPLQVFQWVIERFIPAVAYHEISKECTISYDAFMNTFKIEDYCFSGKL